MNLSTFDLSRIKPFPEISSFTRGKEEKEEKRGFHKFSGLKKHAPLPPPILRRFLTFKSLYFNKYKQNPFFIVHIRGDANIDVLKDRKCVVPPPLPVGIGFNDTLKDLTKS